MSRGSVAMRRSWSSALVQLERDLKMVARRLAGAQPSPVVYARPPAIERPPARSTRDARELVVTRVIRETHDVVTLVLEDPSRSLFELAAGQFFTLLVDADGETVPRNYSASNAPGSRELHLSIKNKPGGRVSGRLCALGPGERLRVLGPFGTFTTEGSRPGVNRLVLLAGGIGITPLLSIARTVLASEQDAQIVLVYGNRRLEDVAFAAELETLVAEHAGRFEVRHVLEEPPEGSRAERGRLDRTNVTRILESLALRDDAQVFVCGPEGMQDEVLAAVTELGIAPERVKRERFAIGSARSKTTVESRDLASEARRITILSPEHLVRTTALAGATLLEAGLAASASMPFSCGVGGCGACRVRLVEGEVDLDEPHCLSDEERRAGYVLACVGKPRGACTIEIEREKRQGGGR